MARLNQHWLTAVLLTLVMSCSGSGGKTPLTDVETTEMDSEVEVDQTQAVCGNGIPEAGEECDNGTANSDDQPDACRTNCTLAACGDGVQDSGEACDDGDANSDAIADACRTSCSLPECGDGVTDTGEQCDDGTLNSDSVADACRTSCVAPSCGDGVTDSGEQCDAGELNSDTQADACRTSCMSAGCGDGVIDSAEACDGENLGSATCANIDQGFSGGTLACAATCDAFDTALCEETPLTCGNGRVDDGEECDNGEDNSDELADACRTNCTNPGCGDSVIDTGETCDAGLENSDSEPDACRTTCQPATCGDTVIDTGESCDDGGDNSDTKADACRTSCQEAGCGDGVVDSGEGCDNGTANSDTEADACRLSCQEAGCGDGVVDSAEDCEGDVGTETCESLGYTSGNLACDAVSCLYDTSDCSATLFFSEYVEGSSNNKALEIYNPSASEVPLTGCSVMLYSNGGTTISQQLDLSGTISGHGTYVICNGSSGPELAALCDEQHAVTNFNGDDTVTLECNAQLLDVIGQLGFDPGAAWGTAPATTVNQTLRRKCSVNAGDGDASDEFVPADEWLGLPIDTFADLGHHCNLGPVVDCRLQWPLSIDFDSASVDESVFGRLSLPGLTDLDANAPTDFADPHPQLLVSLLFGLEADPTETWTLVSASPNAGYNTASPGYEAGWDEYTALLVNAGLADGSYRYAYAVSADSGETWKLCDSNGGDFALTDAGVLNVVSADPCAGVVCDTPPANDCSGDNAQVYESTGTCTAGVCSYAVASTIDCSTSGGCVAGTCADLCGNTVLDPTEVCDADLLGGESCLSQGFLSGTLACAPGCAAFDTAGCVPADGNLGSAIGAAVATGSNVGAGDDFEASCQANNGADLALLWTPPADGCYVIDMVGSTFDTVLHVQTLPDGTEVACNDDAVGTRSRVTLNAALASQQYLLILDAYGTATGDYVLNIQPCPEPVEVITGCPVEFCTETVDGDETTYTYTIPADVHPVVDDAEGACFEGTPGRDLIVIVDTTGINAISASTCTGSTTADASLAIFDGDPTAAGVELACNEDSGVQACAALTNIQVTGSSTYVLVDEYGTGYWTNTTARSFSIVVSSAPYDPCGNALVDPGEACDGSNYDGESCMSLGYAGGPLSCEADCSALIETACIALDGDLGSAIGADVSTGTTVGAGADFSGTCGGTSAPDLAFLWTPPTDGCYRIDTVGSSYDTVLYVRDYLAGTQLKCNNDGAGISPQSMVQIDAAVAGQGYLIVVDGASTNEGDYVLNINPCPEGVEVITGCPVEYCTETPAGGPHGGDLYTYVLLGDEHPIIDDFPSAGCSSFGNGRDLLLVLDMAGYAGFSASTCAADPGDSSLAAFDVDPTGGGAVAVACNGDATGESSSYCSKLADGTGSGTPPAVVSFVEPMLYIQVDEYSTTYWNGTAQRTIQVELIPDDPCFGVTCDAPPADFCTGTVATQYAAPGTCNPGTGVCEYTSSTVDCATTSQECVAGACVNECGNSAIDTGEVCDGTLLNGETCTTLGFAGGTLGCAVDCGDYDDSACIPIDEDLGTAVGDAVSTGTTVGAGNDFSGSCGGGSAADLAFLWSPPSDGCYIISTTGSDYDTVLYVREQPAATQLACRDLSGTESVTLSAAEAAESYLIFVDGFSINEGDYELNINPCPVGVEVITGCPVEYCTESVGAGPNGGTLLTYVLAGADHPRIDDIPAGSCSGFGNGRDLLIVLDMAGYAGFSASTCAANPGDSSMAAYAADPTGGGVSSVACSGDATGESSWCSKLDDPGGSGLSPDVVAFTDPMLYIQVDEYGTSYWNGSTQRTIQVELIPDDPCFGVTCDAPPVDFCTGDVATIYTVPGTCTAGTCSYTSSDVNCVSEGKICVDGACVFADPCTGVTCDTPPAAECVGDSVRTYSSPGTCALGVCDYPFSDYDCTADGDVCDAGACVTPPSPIEALTDCPPEFCVETVNGSVTTYTYTIPAGWHPVVNDAEATCFQSSPGRDLIITLDMTGFNQVSASTCGGSTSADSSIAVFSDVPPTGQLACNEDRTGSQYCSEVLDVPVSVATAYVLVDEYSTGYWNNTTTRTFSIDLENVDLCAGVDCTVAPDPECVGDVVRTYVAPGVCNAGLCAYTYNDVDCTLSGEVCIAGACSVAATPTELITGCPVQFCTSAAGAGPNGGDLLTYVIPGPFHPAVDDMTDATCSGFGGGLDLVIALDMTGYDGFSASTCTAGAADSSLAAYDADPTAGSPVAVACNGDALGGPSYCSKLANPTVSLGNPVVVPFTAANLFVRVDEYDLDEYWDGTSTRTITVELMPESGDPCAGVTCDTPPTDSCSGTVARVYDATGTCSGGVCSYDYLDYDCAGDGDICVAGACVDPCAGVTCDNPPADSCSGTVARLYDTTGTCSGGVCDYTFLDYDCADDGDICVSGACVDPCAGVTCDTPPATECAGDSVRTYNATGTCTGGVCDYGFSDYDCTSEGKVCDAGACVAVTNCGNGVIDAGEVCDGGELNGKTCGDLGWPAGTLACATDCKSYDVAACSNVFISEYIEGGSNNKAVELYNASGHEIDLSTCTLQLYSNGSATATSTYTPSGTLAAGATFTVCNGGSVAGLLDNCDDTSAVTNFNGDDTLDLVCDGVVVDIFGQVGVDPGSAWANNGVSTVNQTLRRKCSITQGNTAGGAFDPSVEWDTFAQDTFDGVGAHCPGSLTIGWCKVQWPNPSFTLDATAVDIFGRVYIAGQTELTQHLYDPHAKVLAQWGFGLSTDVAGFSWVRAVGNDTTDGFNNDEYKASISKALTAGTYRYAYRFSADGGATWAYCDTDDTFAFDPSLAGTMTVTP